jgi:hypothetical protein
MGKLDLQMLAILCPWRIFLLRGKNYHRVRSSQKVLWLARWEEGVFRLNDVTLSVCVKQMF